MNLQKIKNVLIIAPHPDDEVLGCGGIIKKLTSLEKKIYVLVMTNAFIGASELFSEEGIKIVRREALQAHKILGVKETFFADFPAPKLDTYPTYKMANYISALLQQLNIDTLFIPHRGDIHLDHKRVYEASLVASRSQGNYSVHEIYAYETLSETEWAAPFPEDNFIPNVFVNIENEIEYKIKSFECYKTQIKIFPHPRSVEGIDVLSKHRGSVVSIKAVEAFSLIRQIVG
ncbi:MAG: PIG-L deacetylase family protein [Ginsengibacter sp.]